VLAGIFWVGAFLFVTYFLFPALLGAGPAVAGPVMGSLQRRRMMVVLPLAAILTILSGLALVWVTSGGAVGAYARTPMGRAFTGAGGLAIVAFVIGFFVSRPTALAAGQASQQLAALSPGPEHQALQQRLAALQRRATRANRLVAWLLLGATAGMAVARYL
jgi:hypothetical protein